MSTQQAHAPTKNAIITGASAGIGWACAQALYNDGWNLLLGARRAEKIQVLMKDAKMDHERVKVESLDVRSLESIERFFSLHENFTRELSLLVNNAGLALGLETFQESQLKDILTMIETNITGLLAVTHRALPSMIRRKDGIIIQLGSIAGNQAYAKGAVYCATKAAVHRFNEALRYDLGGTGIRLTVIAPGKVAETEFSVVRLHGDELQAKKGYEGYRPLTPADIARSVSWVASLPSHFCIPEMILMPTDQPSAHTIVPLTH